MKSPLFRFRRTGFTLVELLTVMAIIAILMGILLPAINSAIESAKKTQAKNDALGIVNAIKGYYTEYGKYPTASATDVELKDGPLGTMLNELRAKTTTLNPRKIVFLEIPDAKNLGQVGKERAGVTATGVWLDPWGFSYVVWIDADYNNSLVNPYGAGKNAGSDPLSTGVIVYSTGRNGVRATDFKSSDDVISWQ